MTAPTVDEHLAAALGAPVLGLERLTGGSSREVWAFESAGRRLILLSDPPGERRGGGAGFEAGVLRAVRAAGVAAPEPVAVVPGGLVLERLDGETVPRRILDGLTGGAAGARLARQCGEALGRLHTVDPSAVAGLPDEDRLVGYRASLDRLDPDRPVLELAYRWLLEHRPPHRRTTVVHGDFRLGNFVVGGDGLIGVLDWESAHRGDPLEDLGWIAVRSWRFRGPGVVGGFGDAGDFLDAYRAAAGVELPAGDFDWAVVLGTWIWAVGCLQQADRHLSGTTRSIDLALVGRRVVEVEHDLLELLR
ncbi:phosphotransferase family protein [Dactylosporangium matsuzakiense]|uniref:Acyl-CoA dehydrogenase n=1 Tax=Dactylosporangium matsuzakiense TaxID=53360 RepID=A0A9W6NI32_9ACTN|nr:phosphotransferase family protein [Dactylosporangium matsuzakiense]UWZ47116.1 phosphotransferase family protein [Dactylosporangium matsuzakiense]GLK98449.1 acyl-CoA dehydrogenase [Dactylosporangium matsuzakiense]